MRCSGETQVGWGTPPLSLGLSPAGNIGSSGCPTDYLLIKRGDHQVAKPEETEVDPISPFSLLFHLKML